MSISKSLVRWFGFAGAIASVAGLLFALASWRSAPNKIIEFQILAESVIVDAEVNRIKNLQVLYGGERLDRLTAIKFRLLNLGSVAIRSQDFERALRIDFGPEAHLVGSLIVDEIPSNLDVSHKASGSVVLIDPLLLNPGDGFSVEVVLAGLYSAPKIDSRIAGVKKIMEKQRVPYQAIKVGAVPPLVCGLALALVAGYLFAVISGDRGPVLLSGLGAHWLWAMAVSLICFYSSLLLIDTYHLIEGYKVLSGCVACLVIGFVVGRSRFSAGFGN